MAILAESLTAVKRLRPLGGLLKSGGHVTSLRVPFGVQTTALERDFQSPRPGVAAGSNPGPATTCLGTVPAPDCRYDPGRTPEAPSSALVNCVGQLRSHALSCSSALFTGADEP